MNGVYDLAASTSEFQSVSLRWLYVRLVNIAHKLFCLSLVRSVRKKVDFYRSVDPHIGTLHPLLDCDKCVRCEDNVERTDIRS